MGSNHGKNGGRKSCDTLPLKKREEVNHSFKKNVQKTYQKYHFSSQIISKWLVFCEQKSEWAIRSQKKRVICSFIMSDLSQWLICLERSELTVAHLIWAIWANERIPNPENKQFLFCLGVIWIGVVTVSCLCRTLHVFAQIRIHQHNSELS